MRVCAFWNGARGRNRTTDTRIFNPALFPDKSGTCEIAARQTKDGASSTYATNVKPGQADLTKENAAAAGPRNGAKNVFEASKLQLKGSPGKGGFAISKIIPPAYKRMSRTLGYCLLLGSYDAWIGFSCLAKSLLTARERASLAYAALRSLEPEQAEMTAATVLRAAGAPMPPFLRGMEEARFWASLANRAELKAFALASFEAMAPQDQAAFFRHISEIEVAA
ncbi:hypothetical protein [Rhodovulum sulfidophilum]|nr:hypothetical protein [Rhodovulum sulfidophilum]MBL3553865.1 hypothetical protein [Rhodovulum sulfidophilum]